MAANTERMIGSKVWTVGAASIVAAVVVNLILRAIFVAIFPIPAEFMPMTLPPIAIFTALGMVGAIVAFLIVGRMARSIRRTYTLVAVVAFVVTAIPNVLGILNPAGAPMPGGTSLAWLLLIVLHIPPAAIIVWALNTYAVSDAAA
jgi:hypothetical protein